MNKRIFLIVLDSCGIGEAPDAADFGDVGASTIRSISKSKYFNIDTLRSIGFFRALQGSKKSPAGKTLP